MSYSSSPDSVNASVTAGGSVEKLHETISQLEQALVASQRLATLGTMSSMIAHELNNLMTPIQNWLDLALGADEPDYVRKCVGKARAQAERAQSVTQRLIDLSKGAELATDSCSVAEVVRDATATAKRTVEQARVGLHVSVPEDLRVQAQPHLLAQVLLNLLLNALAAMEKQPGSVSLSAHRDGEYVVLDVRDSGRGLSPQQLEEVINPFLAGQEDDGRSWELVGLGLHVCRLIARKHGAALHAFANEGRGCTFRLRWPAVPGS